MKKLKIGIVSNKLYMDPGISPSMYRAYVNQDYIDSIEAAGAVPVMLPVIKNLEDVEVQLSGLDGIILSGGFDLDPDLYGQEPTPQCGFTMREIDVFYIATIKKALEMKIPMLGICKGTQALNVAFGGTLYQDINTQVNNPIKHTQAAPRHCATHSINVKEGTFVHSVFGDTTRVNSYHHQSIDKVGEGLVVAATAPDGVVEIIEGTTDSFVCGLQFHPEMMASGGDKQMLSLFTKFFEKCVK